MEQIADFKNHHVEVDHSHSHALPLPPPKPAKALESKPEIVVTEPGSDTQNNSSNNNKQVIKLVEGLNRKRVPPSGAGWLDNEESEWWERWRRHVAKLDGRFVVGGTALAAKKKSRKRRKEKEKERTMPLARAITNGDVKLEAVDVPFPVSVPRVPPPPEVKDEFAEQVLVVDYEEEEKDDGGVNEDLRVVIKVRYFFQIVVVLKC
jgi:hypothetical protein